MIRDLESLLLTIPDMEGRSYVREAVNCYNAGAYRAAVVLSVAAGMDDLRQKLERVATTGTSDPNTKTGHVQINQKFQNQDSFEGQLIDVCEKATLLTPSEATKLRLVQKARHLCAHPSGHKGTAEEARDAITTVIDLVMSREGLLGMVGVTELLVRLAGPHFFPNPGDQESVRATVKTELAILSPALLNALSQKVIDELVRRATAFAGAAGGGPRTRTIEHENVRLFLGGMLLAGEEVRRSAWRYMDKLIEDQNTTEDTLWVLTQDPAGIALAGSLGRERALGLVRRNLKLAPAREVARAWLAENAVSAQEADELHQAAVRDLITSRELDEVATAQVLRVGSARLDGVLFEHLVKDAASGTFTTANAAIDSVQSLPPEVASRFPGPLRAQYVINVSNNAHGMYTSRSAKALKTAGLGLRVDFVDAFVNQLDERPDEVKQGIYHWKELAQLLESTGRSDALLAVMGALKDADEWRGAYDMFDHLSHSKDATVRARAEEIQNQIRSSTAG
ncbi:MAG TPA: hypothetical protein VF647_02195 [Longimicrobium sp.]|jgi:hypothetical protein